MNNKILGLVGTVVFFYCLNLHSQAQIIVNGNFTTDYSGWIFALDKGPSGSTQIAYGISGGATPPSGSPYTTAGTFTMDASSETDPGFTPPGTTVYPVSDGVRVSATTGGLGSFSQDTGAVFLAGTTYTLSAYASGNSGGSNGVYDTGVALSGGSPLTLATYLANPDLSNVGQSQAQFASLAFVLRTVTIDTALPEYSSLVGQEIYANLVSNNDTIYGRAQYFSGVTLSMVTDVPEPSTTVLIGAGCLVLAVTILRRGKVRLS